MMRVRLVLAFTFGLAVASCLGPAAARGAEPSDAKASDEPSFELAITLDAASRYVWRGLILNDEPVLQPSIGLSYSGLTLGVFGSFDLTDWTADAGYPNRELDFSEVDYTLDYEHSFETITLSAGLGRYVYPGTGEPSTGEMSFGVAADLSVAPWIAVWYDFDSADGFYAEVGADHAALRPYIPYSTVLDDDLRAATDRPDAFLGGLALDLAW